MPPCNSEFLHATIFSGTRSRRAFRSRTWTQKLFGRVITAAPVEGYDTVTVFEQRMLEAALAQRRHGAAYDWTW